MAIFESGVSPSYLGPVGVDLHVPQAKSIIELILPLMGQRGSGGRSGLSGLGGSGSEGNLLKSLWGDKDIPTPNGPQKQVEEWQMAWFNNQLHRRQFEDKLQTAMYETGVDPYQLLNSPEIKKEYETINKESSSINSYIPQIEKNKVELDKMYNRFSEKDSPIKLNDPVPLSSGHWSVVEGKNG